MSIFNILTTKSIKNVTKIALKRKNLEVFAVFTIFGVVFGSFWGPWGQLKKVQKSPQIQIAQS